MRIHQLLYGYRNGHNMLTGSIALSSTEDIILLSNLTDWSGYSSSNKENQAYLSSTYLKESNLYAISLTWYAHEMERTGCVWSHVLLLNPDQIPLTFDFKKLLFLFKRPHRYSEHNYSIDIYLEEPDEIDDGLFNNWDIKWIQIIFSMLITSKGVPLFEERLQREYHGLVLSMLNYLPSDILKEVSITTGYTSKLDQLNIEFGIRITQETDSFDSSGLKYFSKLYDHIPEGIKYIGSNIYLGKSFIIPLIRHFSSDIKFNIHKYDAVGCLLKIFESNNNITPSDRLTSVLEILETYFPDYRDGLNIKISFLNKSFSSYYISEKDFFWIISSFHKPILFCSKQDFLNRIDSFKETELESFQNLLIQLLCTPHKNSYGDLIINHSLINFNDFCIINLFNSNFEKTISYITKNKQYILGGKWLNFSEENILSLLQVLPLNYLSEINFWNQIIPFIDKQNYHIPLNVSLALDDKKEDWVFDVYNSHNISLIFRETPLLKKAISYEQNIVNWVSQSNYISIQMKRYISKNLNPNSYHVRIFGEYVWYNFSQLEGIPINSLDVYIFCFKLGHNWNSELALQYIKNSFYFLHENLKDSRYNELIWLSLGDFCSDVAGVFIWDRCGILRKKVINYFIENNIPIDYLNNFTPSEKLNKSLKRLYKRINN